ncbi:MAG TPA: hypothetical protein VGF55_00480 [Gemmataceae bacterium]
MFAWKSVRPVAVIGAAWAVLALAAAGCQSDHKPKTYPVRGRVVYRVKGEPATRLEGAAVMLEPVADPKSAQVRGEIGDGATFSLGSIIDGQNVGGAPAGEYRVRIDLPGAAPRHNVRLPVDPRFLSYDKSGVRVTIPASTTDDLVIEVEEPRR